MRRPTTNAAGRAATVAVAAVAGGVSWAHIVEVARRVGEDSAVAAVLPISIDGLIVVATAAMVDDRRHGRRPRMSARVALVFGVVATLAANIGSAQPTLAARAVAAIPAVAFLLAVEVLSRRGKPITVDKHQDVDEQPATNGSASTVPAPRRRWRRGELALRVRDLVDQHGDELPAEPAARAARLAHLTGGSERHITRILAEQNGSQQ